MGKPASDLKREFPFRPRQKLAFTVPLAPTQNKAYYNGVRGVRPHAKLYISRINAYIKSVIEDVDWKREKDYVWFYVDMIFYFPDTRFRDNHNLFKILFDGLEGTFLDNDYFILPRVQGCYLDRESPRIEVLVRPQTEVQCEKFKEGFK